MATSEEMSVHPGTIKCAHRSVRLTHSGGIDMAGSKKCEPGCTCKRHNAAQWTRGPGSHRERQRRYRAAHPERTAESSRRYREANPEKVAAYSRRYSKENWQKYGAKYKRKYQYGLPDERFINLLEEQDGCCYLCGEPLDLDKPRGVTVDHDHSCCRGEKSCGRCVLGVACEPCNRGCGAFGDDPQRMRRVADSREAAMTRIAERRAALPVQEELPINVRRMERREESA